jgi:putative transcriptional regulator
MVVRFVLDAANPPRLTPEQQARLDAMTDEELTQHAVDDPDNPPLTEEELERGVLGRRVRLARQATGLSQVEFAARFQIPVATLRDWEQGRRKPDATSLAYITVIEREPEAVERALKSA